MGKFELGDKVILKAGNSPTMLIEAIDGEERYHCVWFDKQENDYKRIVLNSFLLVKNEPKVFLPTIKKSQFRQKLENYC